VETGLQRAEGDRGREEDLGNASEVVRGVSRVGLFFRVSFNSIL